MPIIKTSSGYMTYHNAQTLHKEFEHQNCPIEENFDTNEMYCQEHNIRVCRVCKIEILAGIFCPNHDIKEDN